MNLTQERESLIKKFNELEMKQRGEKEQVIKKIAKNLEQSINEKKPDVVNQLKILNLPEDSTSVVRLIVRIKEKNNWSVGTAWIYRILPQKYKQEGIGRPETGKAETVALTDNYLKEHQDEIKDRLKEINKGPAKDIIPKERVSELERYDWKCWVAQELAKIAIKLEKDHDLHDDKLCKEYSKRMRTVRDKRFATDVNSYEAMVIAANYATSLNNVTEGEWEFKTFWEILEDMGKCREGCSFEQCKKEKCKHECHRVVRPMTTKGYKYAIKTDEYLKNLDKRIAYLSEIDNKVCRIGKILIENPKTSKFLTNKEKKKLIHQHIEKEECLQCDMFMEKNPMFFD